MLKNNPEYYDAHWMPYTSNREFKENPRIMVSAKDSYYIDDKGFYVRYGGDTIQLGLPFIVSEQEIKDVVGAISDSIKELQ